MDPLQFTLRDNKGQIQVSPCLEVLAFAFEVPSNGKGFERFYRAFTKRFGKKLKFYCFGNTKGWRRINKKALDEPSHWFKDPKTLSKKWRTFWAQAGETPQNHVPPEMYITLWGFDDPPWFAFRLGLPVEAAAKPDEVISFCQDALADFPLSSGLCGYSFSWDDRPADLAVYRWMGGLLLKHPGLNCGDAVSLANGVRFGDTDHGIVAVSWLTFVGSKMTERLGGIGALRKKVSGSLSILPLGKSGVLIRAGKMPQLGNLEQKDPVPLYRAVGKLLASCRATNEGFDNMVPGGFSNKQRPIWLRRFFR